MHAVSISLIQATRSYLVITKFNFMLNIPEPPVLLGSIYNLVRASRKSRSIIFAFTASPITHNLDNKFAINCLLTMLIFSSMQKVYERMNIQKSYEKYFATLAHTYTHYIIFLIYQIYIYINCIVKENKFFISHVCDFH